MCADVAILPMVCLFRSAGKRKKKTIKCKIFSSFFLVLHTRMDRRLLVVKEEIAKDFRVPLPLSLLKDKSYVRT